MTKSNWTPDLCLEDIIDMLYEIRSSLQRVEEALNKPPPEGSHTPELTPVPPISPELTPMSPELTQISPELTQISPELTPASPSLRDDRDLTGDEARYAERNHGEKPGG